MMKKLKAIGIILGFIGPVADLIRAIGILEPQARRILEEIGAQFRGHLAELLEEVRTDIECEISDEPTLRAVQAAVQQIEAKIAEAAASGAFKAIAILLLATAYSLQPTACFAQAPPTDFVAAGASYNQYAAPQVSGLLVYAHQIMPGTYSFSAVDLTSKSVRPFVLQTATTTGLARHIRDIGRARVFALGTAGLAAGGENVGGAFSAGGAAAFPLRAGWWVMLTARVLDTSIAARQYAVGLAIGWGK